MSAAKRARTEGSESELKERAMKLWKWYKSVDCQQVTHFGDAESSAFWDDMAKIRKKDFIANRDLINACAAMQLQYSDGFTAPAKRTSCGRMAAKRLVSPMSPQLRAALGNHGPERFYFVMTNGADHLVYVVLDEEAEVGDADVDQRLMDLLHGVPEDSRYYVGSLDAGLRQCLAQLSWKGLRILSL